MIIRELINFSQIQPVFDSLSKSDFLQIKLKFESILDKYSKLKKDSGYMTPKKSCKPSQKTPPTFYSTPKKTCKRKLNITPKKHFSTRKSSDKLTNIEPEKIFGVPCKVNLRDIFMECASSSDESIGCKESKSFLRF